jgi:hypothetical protein
MAEPTVLIFMRGILKGNYYNSQIRRNPIQGLYKCLLSRKACGVIFIPGKPGRYN